MIGAGGQLVANTGRPAKATARDPERLTPRTARALVLAAIDQWVAAGVATLRERGDSSLELRFGTGEVWRLGENAITREK